MANQNSITHYRPKYVQTVEATRYLYPLKAEQRRWLSENFIAEFGINESDENSRIIIAMNVHLYSSTKTNCYHGDWIIRKASGEIEIMSHDNFTAQYKQVDS
jgi:DNA-binding transcriptional regulator/RsmH inhibitor MraZ